MRDLSLHLLDLIENSIRAQATVVAVAIEADRGRDLLRLTIEDNGPGFAVSSEVACDPFYTTQAGKRTGLGLSLFRAAAEAAGGTMAIATSPLGGAMISARMTLSHVDRPPMGDLAATVAGLVGTHPELDLRLALSGGAKRFSIGQAEVARLIQPGGSDPLAVAGKVSQLIRSGAAGVWPWMI